MSRSPSVLRRYTPPTCTLEVIAKDSALSRWAGKPVLKDLRFRLSLDDPKLPQEQWITITGDRAQLAALGEAVAIYVQSFLETSHDRLSRNPFTSSSAETALLTVEDDPSAPTEASPNLAGVSLQPKGSLNHDLYWGNLATAETGAMTQLSTIQLFDLANALDEYTVDALDLPNLQTIYGVGFPNWAQVAAVVLLAVGLSTSVIKLFDGTGNIASVAPTTSQGASSSDQKIATQLPPSVVDKATPPAVSSLKLPPPPPSSTSPVPQPGLPKVVTPDKPNTTQTPGNLPPNAIATYPVPKSPGQPTIVVEPEQSTQRSSTASRPTAKATSPSSEALTADASSQLNQGVSAQQSSSAAARQASPDEAAGSTAFDTIPQVAEVRTYFQQRWTPPEGLNQVLEYSLQLDQNGTIRAITPLKQASGDYIDRTGMPLIGDPFVSPLKGRQTAKVRLVLDPNGQVRSFLEE